jgi:hypothetical protein
MAASEVLVDSGGVEESCSVAVRMLGDNLGEEKRVRSNGVKIQNLDLANTLCDGRAGQRELSGSLDPKGKLIPVNLHVIVMSPEFVGGRVVAGGYVGKGYPARALHSCNRLAGAAKGKREAIRRHGADQVHGKEVAVVAVVHRNEHDGTRADVEDHQLLCRYGRQGEIVRVGVFTHGAILQPVIPTAVRPAEAIVRPVLDLEQPERGSRCHPVPGMLQVECAYGAPRVAIHEMQPQPGMILDCGHQLLVEPHGESQWPQGCDDHRPGHIGLAVSVRHLNSNGFLRPAQANG